MIIFYCFLKSWFFINSDAENLKVMAELWLRYVNFEEREKRLIPFIEEVLREHECRKVLDAAAGIGFEAYALSMDGFEVIANEYNPELRKVMREFLRKRVNVEITGFNWKDFDKHFDKESFDAVLCLGNSLTYLINEDERKKVVSNFYNILRDGGVLLIDTREYFSNGLPKEKLMGSFYYNDEDFSVLLKSKKGPYRYVLYDEITGKKYEEEVYPITREELKKLLEEVGFSIVIEYSDLEEGVRKDAVFYQFVAMK